MPLTRRTLNAAALIATISLGAIAPAAFAQTKWDLPAAYPATNSVHVTIRDLNKASDAIGLIVSTGGNPSRTWVSGDTRRATSAASGRLPERSTRRSTV